MAIAKKVVKKATPKKATPKKAATKSTKAMPAKRGTIQGYSACAWIRAAAVAGMDIESTKKAAKALSDNPKKLPADVTFTLQHGRGKRGDLKPADMSPKEIKEMKAAGK